MYPPEAPKQFPELASSLPLPRLEFIYGTDKPQGSVPQPLANVDGLVHNSAKRNSHRELRGESQSAIPHVTQLASLVASAIAQATGTMSRDPIPGMQYLTLGQRPSAGALALPSGGGGCAGASLLALPPPPAPAELAALPSITPPVPAAPAQLGLAPIVPPVSAVPQACGL